MPCQRRSLRRPSEALRPGARGLRESSSPFSHASHPLLPPRFLLRPLPGLVRPPERFLVLLLFSTIHPTRTFSSSGITRCRLRRSGGNSTAPAWCAGVSVAQYQSGTAARLWSGLSPCRANRVITKKTNLAGVHESVNKGRATPEDPRNISRLDPVRHFRAACSRLGCWFLRASIGEFALELW